MDSDFSAAFAKIVTVAIPFVEKRRKATGGFGATPRLPATIEDTFYALQILALARLLAIPPDGPPPEADPALRDWLANTRRTFRPGLQTISHLLHACRMAGVEYDDAVLLNAVLAKLRDAPFLSDWYYSVQILTEFFPGAGTPRALLGDDCPVRISRLPWRVVEEGWMLVLLAEALQEPALVPVGMRDWLRACQNGDGGFGFMPGTTSFIENCSHTLRAMAMLGVAPSDPDGAWRFLAACQTGSGGFSRNGRAAPFLDATWHGLTCLRFLGNMRTTTPHESTQPENRKPS